MCSSFPCTHVPWGSRLQDTEDSVSRLSGNRVLLFHAGNVDYSNSLEDGQGNKVNRKKKQGIKNRYEQRHLWFFHIYSRRENPIKSDPIHCITLSPSLMSICSPMLFVQFILFVPTEEVSTPYFWKLSHKLINPTSVWALSAQNQATVFQDLRAA